MLPQAKADFCVSPKTLTLCVISTKRYAIDIDFNLSVDLAYRKPIHTTW